MNESPVAQATVGFFTDPTLCIGCKACEVACKEWNQLPHDGFDFKGFSYDNTGGLGASTWRHVKFVELERPEANGGRRLVGDDDRAGEAGSRRAQPAGFGAGFGAGLADGSPSWLFLSDVCMHCENAGCLQACPTGAIVRTEVGSVFVQDDVCNGCGYCVVTCPFGVIDRLPKPTNPAGRAPRDTSTPCDPSTPYDPGGAFKCTFCYDRQRAGLVPACAKACPTESIRFGPLEELRHRASERVNHLRDAGYVDARLYDPRDTSVGGTHAFFLVLGETEKLGLPPRPESPTVYLRGSWCSALCAAVASLAATWLAFLFC